MSVELFTALADTPRSALISWEDAPADLEFLPVLSDAIVDDPDVLIHATHDDALRLLDLAHDTFPRGTRVTPAKLRSVARPMLAEEIAHPFRLGVMSAPALAQ